MNLREFSTFAIRLGPDPFSLEARPHFWKIYELNTKNLIIRASRQCEKSTYLVNRIIYDSIQHPGIRTLFVAPRHEQGALFSRDRLQPTIVDSPLIRSVLWKNPKRRMPVRDLIFDNGSRLFVRPAFRSADGVRGISADQVFIDEFQDIVPGQLPVILETLSHSEIGRTVLVGTPKLADNNLESMFALSTANEWRVTCRNCQHLVVLDERAIGPTSFICPSCIAPIDPSQGSWLPRNPEATWGEGFWVNHIMLCWLNIGDVLARKASYDPIRFANEVLGLPVFLGDHMVTRTELEACCSEREMAKRREDVPVAASRILAAGIDWGGSTNSSTALVIGYVAPKDLNFHVCLFRRWLPGMDPIVIRNEVASLCNQFGVRFIAADGGGNGSVYNRLLVDGLDRRVPVFGIHYSTVDQEPTADGVLRQWTISRTGSISTLLTKIKLRKVRFPRVADCGTFLDEFAGLLAERDDYNRSIKFTHTPGQFDDSVHAANYLHAVALRCVHAHH